LSLAKVILISRHSVRLLFGGVAACPSVTCVMCAVLRTAHSKHVILRHAATPPHNNLRHKLNEFFNINITLARPNYKFPDDGRRPKHVAAT